MRRTFLLVTFSLLRASLLPAQDAKPAISILDFQLSGISVQESRMIIDYMGSGIVETGQYRVIDRMQRESLMKEIEFSNAGCTDEACQLRIGKLLSASLIIVGSLGKVGDIYMLNLKMINVETSETVKTASSTYDNLNALVKDNRRMTFAFLGREETAAASPVAMGPGNPTEPAKPEAARPAAPARTVEQPTVAAPARALTEEEIRGRDRAFWTTVVFDSVMEAAYIGVGIPLGGSYMGRYVLPGILAIPPVGPFLSGDLGSGFLLSGIKVASAAALAVFYGGELGIAAAAVDVGIGVWDAATVGGAMERKYRNTPAPAGAATRPLTTADRQAVDTAFWITMAGDLSECIAAALFVTGIFGTSSSSQLTGIGVASGLPPFGPFFTGDLAAGLIMTGIKAASGAALAALWYSGSGIGPTIGGFLSVAVNVWDIVAVGDAMERKLRGAGGQAAMPADAFRVTLQPVYGRDGRMAAVSLLAAVRL